jgi:hypothetical protein
VPRRHNPGLTSIGLGWHEGRHGHKGGIKPSRHALGPGARAWVAAN